MHMLYELWGGLQSLYGVLLQWKDCGVWVLWGETAIFNTQRWSALVGYSLPSGGIYPRIAIFPVPRDALGSIFLPQLLQILYLIIWFLVQS